MGIFASLRASAKTLAVSPNNVGNFGAIENSLDKLQAQIGEQDSTVGDTQNEVQTIGVATGASDGTYTLTVTLANGETCTTGNLNHDDAAAVIEAAIDTAADGVLTGFTAGDISVAGGPLDTDDVTLTFDGTSVAGTNHPLASVDDTNLVGGTAGAVTTTQAGGGSRPAWDVLVAAGVVIASEVPEQGEDATLTATATTVNNNPYYPDQDAIRFLALEAGLADENEQVETEILRIAGLL